MGLTKSPLLLEDFVAVPGSRPSLAKDRKCNERETNHADKSCNRKLPAFDSLRRNREEGNCLCGSGQEQVHAIKEKIGTKSECTETNDRPKDHQEIHHSPTPYRRFRRYSKHITRSARWKALRVQALRRDDWQCVCCGARGRLEVDHIKPVRTHPELAFTLSNLQSLCGVCHARKTRIECGHPPPSPERIAWRDAVNELTAKHRSE